jgi:hypothetical protein
LASAVRKNPDVVVALSMLVLINSFLFLFWSAADAKERRYLAMLQQIRADVGQLRGRSASDKEWQEFGKQSRLILAPIVQDLKKSASAAQPSRQELLWAARDILPKTFGPPSAGRDREDRQLAETLARAAAELSRRSGRPIALDATADTRGGNKIR